MPSFAHHIITLIEQKTTIYIYIYIYISIYTYIHIYTYIYIYIDKLFDDIKTNQMKNKKEDTSSEIKEHNIT